MFELPKTPNDSGRTVVKFLEYCVIVVFYKLASILPLRVRSRMLGWIGSVVVRIVPGFRKRILGGLAHTFPDIPEAEAKALCSEIGRNTGRSFSELLFNEDYAKQTGYLHARGDGLDALRSAKAEGRGAIVVSAHYGQWEAIRHFMKAEGMETGAIYRKNNNPWYETLFRKNIEFGGGPIVQKGKVGNLQMVKHLRRGGFFALLVDQKYQSGYKLDFLGRDAMTTTSPAELALRYDLPIVPCFGTRREDGLHVDLDFEAPIEPSDVLTMTQQINDRISAKIRAHPEQWYWLHKRWADLHFHDALHGDGSSKDS